MKLFPSGVSNLYLDNGNNIKHDMEEFYQLSNDKNQSFWYQAELDSRFEAGDQTVWSELYGDIPLKQKDIFSFNRIRRMTNMVSGHQRKNRKSTNVIPVSNGDQKTADQYSKIISHIHRKEYVLETISDAFHDAIITGLSFLNVWNDYRSDPVSGDIKVDHVSYNSLIIDPYFKKSDLSDCNAMWKRSFISCEQAKSLLPDKIKQIDEISSQVKDNLFTFLPEHSAIDRSKLLAYDEYYYLSSREQILLTDSQTGETMEWNGSEDSDQLKQYLNTFPTVAVSKIHVPSVKLAILIQGVLIHDDKNPLGIDSFPFIPLFGYFNSNSAQYELKIQGMVRGLRDAQYLYNRRKNIELDILQSQINSGLIYKEDALVNPNDAFLTGQGKGLALKSTAMMTDVQQIAPPQIPPSMFQLSEILAREIMEISGVNEELLGSASDDKAGILSMLRQGASLTTLQTLFDQLDRSQRQLGSLMIKAIQCNYTPGKVKRIIEEEPNPQFYNKAFGIYDAAVEDGFDTTTQKQQEFAQLLHLKEAGVAIPDSAIVKAATLQNKNELIEAIEQQQKQEQEQQQRQQQTEEQLRVAQAELAKAKVESDLSLAKERDSRVYSNIGLMHERELEAEKDKTQSMLNLVKTLQEMEDIDINQLTKLVQLSQIVKTSSDQDNQTKGMGGAIISGATKQTDAGQESKKPTL